ncbi:energy-coupling factor transporter transmembrane component T family protein [Anaerovibrio slackiae]|uniref:energy-coupling factor transporter transmembrane component T family protein n=1 Tax=Anaerovibrio slackiae TaxID=2652309 RepID=UPI00386E3EFA
MLTDITLGQYFPGNSLLHRMDARVKIVLLFFYIVGIFLFDNNWCYLMNTMLALVLVGVSRISHRVVLKAIKPLWWILLLTFIIQLFSVPGEVLMKVWIFDLTYEGLEKGFFISLRLILLIGVSSLLMFTTSPLMLTDALEALFKPLKKVGFPAHELAMMMTIALRFIPTLMEETDKIMKAQKSRGSDIGEGNLIAKAKSMIPILVPLFISAFRRADELAMAMEARSYRGGEGRTRMKAMRMHKSDGWAIGMMAVYMMACGAVYWLL